MGISSEDDVGGVHLRHQLLLQRSESPLTIAIFILAPMLNLVLKVLVYGRNRKVIFEAARKDPECVLANILATHFASSKLPSSASSYLAAASSCLVRTIIRLFMNVLIT